jgi:endonuclease/exonuclease/phosphatase family metal-dependent hydrolase
MEEIMNRPERARLVEIGLFAVLFLVFFQLLTTFIETTYVFGLLQTDIPVEIVAVLFLFLPVVLSFIKRPASNNLLIYLGLVILVCRAVSVMLDTRFQMLLSGFGSGLFLVFLPLALNRMWRKVDNRPAGALAIALSVAVLLSVLLRSFSSGNDISEYGSFRAIPWLLAAFAYALLPAWTQESEPRGKNAAAPFAGNFWRISVLILGLISSLTLLYFAFTSPTVISRWTGMNHVLITALAAAALVLFIVLRVTGLLSAWIGKPGFVFGWNVLFLFAFIYTIWSHQIFFPSDPAAYPFYAPAAGGLAGVTLILMLLLYPVVFVNVEILIGEILSLRPSVRILGGGFLLGGFFLLLLIFAQVFTTVYDYIPVIGPVFRDQFWMVFLVGGAAAALPLLLVRRERIQGTAAGIGVPGTYLLAPALVLGSAVILALLLVTARPSPAPEKTSLRILTYNIQQGYSEEGLKNFDGQLELISSMNADLIGLQESDTARIAGGNADVVRYMADRLNMYAYYGPTTVTGTFGIALLSRYPIENEATFFMYSEGEQTAAIEAEVRTGGRVFHVLVTHLGNRGPLIQQQQVLERLEGRDNVIAMGDFNFRPDSEQYAQTTAVLDDAWLSAGQQRLTPEGQIIERRIDHIFLSPGIQVIQAEYVGTGPSDHPAMFAEIAW